MKYGFSVIMPTYNQTFFIRRAILSLQKQTFTNWELIIVNDGCTDETEFFISDFLVDPKIKYIKNNINKGLGYAINQGLNAAKYEYIAYLPSDDFYYENHLKSLIEVLQKYTDSNLAFSGLKYQTRDTMTNSRDTESDGIKKNHTLQLVQVAHRNNPERWVEREEWVTENLFDMYWKKLIDKGSYVPTNTVSCFWTCHPHQRHKIIGERYGGGLNLYRAYYKIQEPIKIRISKYKSIDEKTLYSTFRKETKRKADSLKILIVGELAYNPERIYALEQAGHQLYGLWIPKPEFTFNTVGPLPFGKVINIPYENRQKHINRIKPDIIYALLNTNAIDLAYDVLKANPQIPFVWHFKEGPSVALTRGLWDRLIYLYTFSDGKIYLNDTARAWYEQFVPSGIGLDFILDGDIPKKDYFRDNFSNKLSKTDGAIHTLVAGRQVGLGKNEIAYLANNNIHVHSYQENYHSGKENFYREMYSVAPKHFHIHPHCSSIDWTKEFSKYDAGWLHNLNSNNRKNLLFASWDDLNIPARINTYAAAGLPIILKDNSEHRVAVQDRLSQLNTGIFFGNMKDLVCQLKDEKVITIKTANAIKHRNLFSFDYHVNELIDFFRNVIKHKKKNL
ncbi:glycosyltransferase family 2 protein [Dysgonomonas termitidis]|uniref:Glycosyltransferase family 2 protein n=1 Tax=Dysgonomonas termitidis TaxID=1516126 RepID=A0ABV9KS46_9BACT